MDLCIKTPLCLLDLLLETVSILVLMDLCIKTLIISDELLFSVGFNPCFNGSMYKNFEHIFCQLYLCVRFNPCFNGSMYKNNGKEFKSFMGRCVSILVLMDLCIKTIYGKIESIGIS